MKRIISIFSVIMILFFAGLEGANAQGFKIVETSPKDGADGVPNENLSVKVFFNEEVYSKENEKENRKLFKILDKKGKEIKTEAYFNPKDRKVVLVLVSELDKNGDIKKMGASENYQLVVDGNLKSAKGNTLGESYKVKFKTLNPSTNMMLSMGMMLVMIIVMIVASSRSMKKEQEKEKRESKKHEKFNPYKVAKETGKSVEEVMDAENKRKEKESLKEKKKQRFEEEEEDEDDYFDDSLDEDVIKIFKVSQYRSAAAAGSKYVNKKREEYKKKAEIEAKIKANKKGKSKGKKKR